MTEHSTRRKFIGSVAAGLATTHVGKAFLVGEPSASADRTHLSGQGRRIGAVAYAFQYSIGLFSYRDRPGGRMSALQFVEATRDCGGDVAHLFYPMITALDDDELKQLRTRAEELGVVLEVHGGSGLNPRYEAVLKPAAALGITVLGCSFGMLMRPGKIATLDAWDTHMDRCQARLKELARTIEPLGMTIGVENHLDFTTEELLDLVKNTNSSRVGVLFDVGNSVGTLDDPSESADLLGPHVVATHYKDFAIEETDRGFRFTMVPLGSGSLRLREITDRLTKHLRPEVNFPIEMMNGQHFDVNWLDDGFWTPYRNKQPQQIAATLRHIRSHPFDPKESIPVEEFDKLSHEDHLALESDRMRSCIKYLRNLVT